MILATLTCVPSISRGTVYRDRLNHGGEGGGDCCTQTKKFANFERERERTKIHGRCWMEEKYVPREANFIMLIIDENDTRRLRLAESLEIDFLIAQTPTHPLSLSCSDIPSDFFSFSMTTIN